MSSSAPHARPARYHDAFSFRSPPYYYSIGLSSGFFVVGACPMPHAGRRPIRPTAGTPMHFANARDYFKNIPHYMPLCLLFQPAGLLILPLRDTERWLLNEKCTTKTVYFLMEHNRMPTIDDLMAISMYVKSAGKGSRRAQMSLPNADFSLGERHYRGFFQSAICRYLILMICFHDIRMKRYTIAAKAMLYFWGSSRPPSARRLSAFARCRRRGRVSMYIFIAVARQPQMQT